MKPTIHHIMLREGLQLEYVEQGAPDGLPVLLLHGFTDSWRSFEPVLADLPPRLRVDPLTARPRRIPTSRPPATERATSPPMRPGSSM